MLQNGKNKVVLSIDVGIRNMACCKAVVSPCGKVVEILYWTVLDLAGGGEATDVAAAAVTCVQCAGRKRPFQAAFVHAAHPPLCGPHAHKIEGMFFPLPIISAAARKRKRRADAQAQEAAFGDDGVVSSSDGEAEDGGGGPVLAAAAASAAPVVKENDTAETAIAERYVVTKSALSSMPLPQLLQFAKRHRGFAGAPPPPTGGASKKVLLERMLEHMTSHTWQRTGDAAAMGASAAKMSVVDAGMRFAVEAQRLRLFAGVDEMIVENQLGHLSSRMKSMQDVVMCMAVFAGVPKVRAVSAVTKLNHLECAPPQEDDDDDEGGNTKRPRTAEALARSNYVAHKKDGIAACRAYMAANPVLFREWAAVFERTKKKDDLADSLLQLLGQLQ